MVLTCYVISSIIEIHTLHVANIRERMVKSMTIMNVTTLPWSYVTQQAVMFGFWFLFLRVLYGEFRRATRAFQPKTPQYTHAPGAQRWSTRSMPVRILCRR